MLMKIRKKVGGGGVFSFDKTELEYPNNVNHSTTLFNEIPIKKHTLNDNFEYLQNCQSHSESKEIVHRKLDNTHTRFMNTSAKRRNSKNKHKEESMRMNNNDYNKNQRTSYKTKTMKTTTQRMLMWLLAFCAMLAFALQPMFSAKMQTLDAGCPTYLSGNYYYKNAPMYIAGDKGSAKGADYSLDMNEIEPLFTTSGINTSVILDLLDKVNDSKVWGSKTVSTGSDITYLTARDFGRYTEDASTSNTSQIVLKLLDTTTNSTNEINSASQQLWQAVYRSVSATQDVLTLYMVREYTRATFDTSGSPYSSVGSEGNYSASSLRTLVQNLYGTMKSSYSALDQFVVAPNAIPGLWQSSSAQTANASNGASFGLGSSAMRLSSSDYALQNGLDGLSAPHSRWSKSVARAYTDKLWIPSNFEVAHTDSTRDGALSMAGDHIDATLSGATNGPQGDGRSGLWELNGFDRAAGNPGQWTRSGSSLRNNKALFISGEGGFIGDEETYYDPDIAHGLNGVRVALHIDLKELAEQAMATIEANTAQSGVTTAITASSDESTSKWAPTMKNYYLLNKQFVEKNIATNKGTATVTYNFDTTRYNLSTLVVKNPNDSTIIGTIDLLANPSGTLSNAFSYSSTKTGGTSGNMAITIHSLQQNVKIEASFVELGYSITYVAGAGATGANYVEKYNITTNATILAHNDSNLNYSKTGYHFQNWSGSDGGTYFAGNVYTSKSDLTLTAVWGANTYTIVFHANAPSGVVSPAPSEVTQAFVYDTPQSLKTNVFSIAYHAFSGWAASASGAVEYVDGQSVSNLTTDNGGEYHLYAVWTKTSCTVTFDINRTIGGSDAGFVMYILKGTKSAYTGMIQMYITQSQKLSLELGKNTTYTIVVSKPYTWRLYFGKNGELTEQSSYTFTTPNAGTYADEIKISIVGGSNLNNWIEV